MVSDAGGRKGFVYRDQQDVYKALRRKGYSKTKSARIANSKHGAGGSRKRGVSGRKVRR